MASARFLRKAGTFVIYAPTTGATGGSTFRLSTSGYIFNWDTSYVQSVGVGCFTIVLNLAGGTTKRTSLYLQ